MEKLLSAEGLVMAICLLSILAAGYAIFKLKLGAPFFMAMALTEDRDTPKREGKNFNYKVAASKIYAGGLVVLNSSGYAEAATTATGKVAIGRANETVDNSAGSAGDLSIEVEEGIFRFDNSASSDAITIAEIGDACYIVDDETVAKTSGSATRSIAGFIRDVDSDGVWVEVRNVLSLAAGLVAASNLSDVGSVATARSNIGANKVVLEIEVGTLVGTGVYRVVSPVAGTISKIYSVIDGVLTTGDATLTGKIGATGITAGAITITQSGSAAGDVDSCTPSALNVVSVGDVISVTVGGTNATASGAKVSVLILT